MGQSTREPTAFKPWVMPAVGAVLCLAFGVTAGLASAVPGDWYAQLTKPPGNPPAWVFGPVWTVLYLLLGSAAGILANRRAVVTLCWLGVQFVLDLAWSPVFFGFHRISAALGVAVLLWATALITVSLARRVSPAAGWLMLPHLVWLSFAVYLNAGIFVANP